MLASYQKEGTINTLVGFGAKQIRIMPDGSIYEDAIVSDLIQMHNC